MTNFVNVSYCSTLHVPGTLVKTASWSQSGTIYVFKFYAAATQRTPLENPSFVNDDTRFHVHLQIYPLVETFVRLSHP